MEKPRPRIYVAVYTDVRNAAFSVAALILGALMKRLITPSLSDTGDSGDVTEGRGKNSPLWHTWWWARAQRGKANGIDEMENISMLFCAATLLGPLGRNRTGSHFNAHLLRRRTSRRPTTSEMCHHVSGKHICTGHVWIYGCCPQGCEGCDQWLGRMWITCRKLSFAFTPLLEEQVYTRPLQSGKGKTGPLQRTAANGQDILIRNNK